MQSEIRDNEKFAKNDDPPVLDTPHFDDEEIAQAKPVQPLAGLNQRRTAWMPRMVSLAAMFVAGLVVTSALAIGFAGSNSLLRSATNDGAGSNEIATTEQPASDESQVVRAKSQTRPYQRRNLSTRRFERPRLIIRFGDGDDRKPKARLVSVIQ